MGSKWGAFNSQHTFYIYTSWKQASTWGRCHIKVKYMLKPNVLGVTAS